MSSIRTCQRCVIRAVLLASLAPTIVLASSQIEVEVSGDGPKMQIAVVDKKSNLNKDVSEPVGYACETDKFISVSLDNRAAETLAIIEDGENTHYLVQVI